MKQFRQIEAGIVQHAPGTDERFQKSGINFELVTGGWSDVQHRAGELGIKHPQENLCVEQNMLPAGGAILRGMNDAGLNVIRVSHNCFTPLPPRLPVLYSRGIADRQKSVWHCRSPASAEHDL